MSTYATELTLRTGGSEPPVDIDVARDLLIPNVDGYVARITLDADMYGLGPAGEAMVCAYLTEEQAGLIAAALVEIVTP